MRTRRRNPEEPLPTKRKIGNWEITIGKTRGPGLAAYVDGPSWSDSGLIYHDFVMRWDFPERIPAGVKKTAYSMLEKAMKATGRWPPR